MVHDDRTTDTGMLGSDADNPGPGRDTRHTDPDPAATSTEHPTRTVGMSGSDPERTRLGSQETSGQPLAGAPRTQPPAAMPTPACSAARPRTPDPAATPATPTPPLHPVRTIRWPPQPCPTPSLTAPGSAATSVARLGSNNSPVP